MFDPKTVSLGIAPIGWCNDDMPELGAENTFQQTVSEMALAGFTGCEIGNKYPTDPAELKKALDLRGMRIASRWYSSFILTRSMEEEEKDFIANLDFLAAVGANRINVSEQSYSIQGKMDVPVLTGGHKHVMDDAEWKLLCDGLNKLGKIAADRGFKLCFHHHMATVVQTFEETKRLMDNTDPRYVYLCFDTGHFTFSGEDAVKAAKEFGPRIGHVHLKDIRPHRATVADIYAIGIPSIIMQSIGSVMMFGMNKILISFTEAATAVFGAYFKLQSFIFMPCFGLNNAMVPIVSYNYGAQKFDRVRKTVRLTVFTAIGIMCVGCALFELIPETLLGMFSPTDEMLSIGRVALRIIGVHFPLAGFSIIAGSACQALGKPIYALINSVCRQIVVLLPAAYLLSLTGRLELVWLAFPIAEVVSVILNATFLRLTYRVSLERK